MAGLEHLARLAELTNSGHEPDQESKLVFSP
jgi:hypothetical protein